MKHRQQQRTYDLKNTAGLLLIALFTTWGNLHAQTPVLPTLPQATVNIALPSQGTSSCPTITTGSNCIRSPGSSAANFQSALNAATCGDTIVLVAGYTYSGNFTVPATSCTNNSGWIEVVSANLSSLPGPGNRVGPSDASNMPIISTSNSSPAIQFNSGANHWRLIGIEITTSYGLSPNVLFYMIGTGNTVTSVSSLPSYIILDRCYVVGVSNMNVQHAIDMDAEYMAIVDSDCDEIHYHFNDSQCIFGFNGPGPFLIQNNFIQGSTENIMFGGTGTYISNMIPSDITIVGNLFQKNLNWYVVRLGYGTNYSVATGNPTLTWTATTAYPNVGDVYVDPNGNYESVQTAGTSGSNQPTWPTTAGNGTLTTDGSVTWKLQYYWVVKNLFECKNAQRVLIDGNVFQYTWSGGQDESFIIRSGADNNWDVCQDFTITHNLIQHSPMCIVAAGNLYPGGGMPNSGTQYLLFRNNLCTDIHSATWGGTGYGVELQYGENLGLHDVTIDHNTIFEDQEAVYFSSGAAIPNVQITNNIMDYGQYGIAGDGTSGNMNETLTTYTSNLTYGDFVFTTTRQGTPYTGGGNTLWAGSLSGVGFTSYSGTDPNLTGNFQLLPSSPYYRAGTDGEDIGVWDWACLNSDTSAALAGTFVPSQECAVTVNLPKAPTHLTATVQ